MGFKVIVIGTSAGGIDAVKRLLINLNNPGRLPIIILQHMNPNADSYLADLMEAHLGLPSFEVEDKMTLEYGCVYTPAPNYHMLLERDFTFTLTTEERVCYARPSVDVLFESVGDACKEETIAILLTGANHDGAAGMKHIKDQGGYTMIQEPASAYARRMPESALELIEPDFIGNIEDIKSNLEHILYRDWLGENG